ncbi:BspA family leucine-rich repeat surface protein [Lacticaseibacillus suilingensis]|uniref:BspA family leucine-rich repeat surface protein n=1 Tax=Lacticaseibacillus suilingensis TaxID=2799577 RepID=A0ABW4BBT6_9LACO|nr:DUF285 domain-containing protein [Lacticaseibacillus suilingensis]
MSKQERRRVRVAASLGLTVLMSSAILGGVAPLTANAAEVGSEPTTTEISPMITAPDNPSDAVSSLPAADDIGAEVVEETPDPAEEEKEEAFDPDSEENADRELPSQSENIEADGGQAIEQAPSTVESTEDILLAEADVIDGDWGDVHWTFEDGLLSLSGGTGVGTHGISPWRSIATQVTKVEITGQIIAPANIQSLFANFSAVTSFEGLSNMDTSNVTVMWNTFRDTSSLESIDLSSWDVSKVNDIDGMFAGSGLISLDLSTWQITKPMHASNTFGSMRNLEFLNISSFVFSYARYLGKVLHA